MTTAIKKNRKRIITLTVWLISFAAIVWVSNYTMLGYFLKRHYTYSNYNGTFSYDEMRLKGFTYETRDEGYQYFLEKNPNIKNKQLYRTFTLDPWRFWEWREWIEHFDRFALPYISKKEIQRNRQTEGLAPAPLDD